MKYTFDWREYARIARAMVSEGCVLLKNDKSALPVKKGEKVDDKYRGIMDEKVIHSECFYSFDRFFFNIKQNKITKAIESKFFFIYNCFGFF